MPVDLRPSQSIIESYAQGRAELERKLNQRKAEEQQTIENQQKEAALLEQKRQHDEMLKQRDLEFKTQTEIQKATNALSKYLAVQKFQEQSNQTGKPPVGFVPDESAEASPMIETSPGVFEPEFTYYKNPELGISFKSTSPKIYAQEQAELARIEQQPKIDAEYELFLKKELQNRISDRMKSDSTFDSQKALMELENGYATIRDTLKYNRDLGLANIRADAAERLVGTKAANKSMETWTQYPLDPVAKEYFGDTGAQTWGDIFQNGELSTEGKKLFQTAANVELALNKVLPKLEKQYPTKDGGLISGYEMYFEGAIKGRQSDLLQQLDSQASAEVESIRKDLGRIFLAMKENANLGSVLSENEKKLLETFVAGVDRKMTVKRAKAMIPDLLQTLREERINNVISYGKEKAGTVPGFTLQEQ